MSERYNTPVPPDYATVWGFVARNEPHLFDIMVDSLSLLDDEIKGVKLAEIRGADIFTVPSPPAVAEAGIPEAIAFPIGLLNDLFPANP